MAICHIRHNLPEIIEMLANVLRFRLYLDQCLQVKNKFTFCRFFPEDNYLEEFTKVGKILNNLSMYAICLLK